MTRERFEREVADASLVLGLAFVEPGEACSSHLTLSDQFRRYWWQMWGRPPLNNTSRLFFLRIVAFYKFETPIRIHAGRHDIFDMSDVEIYQLIKAKCLHLCDNAWREAGIADAIVTERVRRDGYGI